MSNISDHSADISVESLLNKLDSSASCILLTRFLCIILEHRTWTLRAECERCRADVQLGPFLVFSARWRRKPAHIYRNTRRPAEFQWSRSPQTLLIFVKRALKLSFSAPDLCLDVQVLFFSRSIWWFRVPVFRTWTSTARPKTRCGPSLLTSERLLPQHLQPSPSLLRVKLLHLLLHHLTLCSNGTSCIWRSQTRPACVFGCFESRTEYFRTY